MDENVTKEISTSKDKDLVDSSTRSSETSPLSPIREVDEHILNESSFLDDKEEVNTSIIDNTLYTTSLDLNATLTSEELFDYGLRAKQPETPPEVLRERLNGLKSDYEYLASEHEELVEYTRLEKQVCHSECASQELVKQQENQLEYLFKSVESLKDENQSLLSKLSQKNTDIKLAEDKLAAITESMKNMSNTITLKLSSILKDGCKEKGVNISSLDHTLNNNDIQSKEKVILKENSSENYCQNMLNLIDFVVAHHFETHSSLKQSKLEQEVFLQEKETINVQIKTQQKELSSLKTENLFMQEIIANSKTDLEEITKKQIASQIDLDNLISSLSKEKNHVKQLKKQLENTVTLNDVQEEFQTIFHKLCIGLDEVDCINDLHTSFSSLSSNPNLAMSVNLTMNDLSQTCLVKLIDKVSNILSNCVAECETSKSNLSKSNDRIEVLEKEIHVLKEAVSELRLEISENLNGKVCALENQIQSNEKNYKEDQLKFTFLEGEIAALNQVVSELKDKLQVTEDQLKLSDGAKTKMEKEIQNFKRVAKLADHENCRQVLMTYSDILRYCDDSSSLKDCLTRIKESKELLACVNPFLDQQTHETFLLLVQNLIEKTYQLFTENKRLKESNSALDENVCKIQCEMGSLKETFSQKDKDSCQYCLEELKQLRELIATEIENLDQEDSRNYLLNYSSRNIFTKLMQNIMNKETEFKEDIEKRYQEDLEKAKIDVEESKNKRKSQEFWVIELQNENDAINKELTTLKTAKIELDRKIKMLISDLKKADSENSSLKSKHTELIVEKDTLLSEVTSLKKCLEAEIDKCENLKSNLEKMSTEYSKCVSSASLQEDNIERRETSFDGTKCDTSTFNFDVGKVKADYGLVSSKSEYANCYNSQVKKISNARDNPKYKADFDNCILHLKKEKDFLTEVINDIDDESFGENLLASVGHLTLSRGIVQLLSERFVKIEQSYNSNLSEFQNDLDNVKSSIVTLYECIATDNPMFDDESLDISNGFAIKIGNELEFVKDECERISNFSRDIEEKALRGTMFIQKLKDEFQKAKREVIRNESLVEELEKTVVSERSKICEQEKETEHVKTKLETIVMENSSLHEQVNQLNNQVRNANLKMSNLGIDFPANNNNLESKLDFLVEICEKEIQTLRNKYDESQESTEFFVCHFSHLLPHLNQLEIESKAVHNTSKSQCREIENLKQMLSVKEKELNESNLSLNQIVSALPMTVSTPYQAVEVINHIVSLLRQAEETNSGLMQQLNVKMEELQSLNSTDKLNSNLKLQLSEFEEQIRSLRSELRSLRSKYQRKAIENNKLTNKTTTEVQTDALCCRHVRDKYEKQLESQGSIITELKLQIQQGGSVHVEKVKRLECSLKHAKERIGTLNRQLIQQKNVIKDLIDQQKLRGASGDNGSQNSP